MSYTKQTVVFGCDIGPDIGIGHLMRCVALAEELRSRGARIVFAAGVEAVPLAAEQLRRRGFERVAGFKDATDATTRLAELDASIVVLDSYRLPETMYAVIRSAGYPVVAVVDYDLACRSADLYVDQNLGAERTNPAIATDSRRLAGASYVMLRDEIVNARPDEPRSWPSAGPANVFGFFGGTDPAGVAAMIARALIAADVSFAATIVAASSDQRAEIANLQTRTGQRVEAIPPTDQLADHVTRADVVVSAAGTSTWELLCLGAATGLVCVADNQRQAYELTQEAGVAVGVATADELVDRSEDATERLRTLLTDPRQREQLRTRGMRLVDGLGRRRVADAVVELMDRRERVG